MSEDFTHVFWWNCFSFFFFIACWIGFGIYLEWMTAKKKTLTASINRLRLLWAQRMLDREIRIADTAMVASLMRSISFLASTTLLILGGVFALLGSMEHTYVMLMEIPYVQATSKSIYSLKVILLAAIFVYAFFKFTWSLQQFNFFNIMMGSSPEFTAPKQEKELFAYNIARINELGGRSYYQGLRSYYFAFAALLWFVHYLALIGCTLIIVGILYRREFHSRTFKAFESLKTPLSK